MSASNWPRLARYVRERRNELGLTQEEIATRDGPSTATLRLIENGSQTAYRAKSLRQLEDALEWARGSVRAILAGGEPAPASADTPRSPVPGDELSGRVLEFMATRAGVRRQVEAEVKAGTLTDPHEIVAASQPLEFDEIVDFITTYRVMRKMTQKTGT